MFTSNIDCVVLNTEDADDDVENKFKIIKNTSRFNNEIIKQRVDCIPVHISDITMPIEQYVEVELINEAENIYLTTEKCKLKILKMVNTYLI